MKLVNKKTGELANIMGEQNYFRVYTDAGCADYGSLAELNEEWEDYVPAEPLIKNEKIRKAVRAWAEANGVGRATYVEDNYRFFADDTEAVSMIEFEKMPEHTGLRNEHSYTIAELCGEEEE